MKKLLLLLQILFIIGLSSFSPTVSNPVVVASVVAKEQVVYITKTGKKYHKGNCRYLKNSKSEMKLNKAKELGYTACAVCKP